MLACIWAHEDPLSIGENSDVPFTKILNIKKMADMELYYSAGRNGRYVQGDAADIGGLGESEHSMMEIEVQAGDDAHDEKLLLRADKLLNSLAKSLKTKQLGESLDAHQEFPKIKVRNPYQISETVKNVVKYLKGLVKDGKTLDEEQIHEARKWYLQTTALVLGRYAFEDKEATKQHTGSAGFDSLKSRAEEAKQAMDKIDAAEHLHKMGADSWMDDSGTNIVKLMDRTGRLARFLSEIEEVERSKRQMGETVKSSSVNALEARESEITAAINQLLASVEVGDPITGAATKDVAPVAAKDSAREKKLMGKLISAADKEDKARIVEAAGDVAEKQMSKVMKDASDDINKKEQEIETEDDNIPVIYNAVPMVMKRDDLAVPMGTLHKHVRNMVNDHLDKILKLFHSRKIKSQPLSLDDYKNVNSQLRGLAAHLMQKYAAKEQEVPVALKAGMTLEKAMTMPLASVAWMKHPTEIAAEHKIKKKEPLPQKDALPDNNFGNPFAQLKLKIPVHEALKKPLHRVVTKHTERPPTKPKVESPKPEAPKEAQKEALTVPAPKESPAPARDPVTQFVWHTIGQEGVQRIDKAKTLEDLLRSGVHLQTGMLRFASPQ